MLYKFYSPSVYLPEALDSSSCMGKGIPHIVVGSAGTTDSMVVVAALQKCQSLLLDTVQPKKQTIS